MSPIDRDLVRRKLAVIARNLDALRAVQGLHLDAYREDAFRRKGTERMLQEIVDAAVDANLHLLRSAGAASPADAFTSFTELGRAGIIPEALARRLAPSAGLRNRLVHEYDRIEDAQVLAAVRRAGEDCGDYIAAVEAFLEASA